MPVKLSPDLAVLVEMVELVQTEIGVPAVSVKTLGGGGGGAAADEPDEGALILDAPVLAEVIPGLAELPEGNEVAPDAVFDDVIVPASPAAGEAVPSTIGVGDAVATFWGVVDCEEQPTCASSVVATNRASRKIRFEFIAPFLNLVERGSLDS